MRALVVVVGLTHTWHTPIVAGATPEEWPFAAPEPTLEMDDNPVVNVLYAPNGALLLVQRERNTKPFGFQP